MVTRPDEPLPDDVDVTAPDDGHSERPEDNEGPFEVDTDKLRVKPEDEWAGRDYAEIVAGSTSHPVPRIKERVMPGNDEIKGTTAQAGGRIEQAEGDLPNENNVDSESALDEAKTDARAAFDTARESVHGTNDEEGDHDG
ncbi:MAG TPA: hypothetical protein VGF46_05250 [Gaiellales bacterium]|jgi:uncharacterized protein YjbJ (UPF0337 family)